MSGVDTENFIEDIYDKPIIWNRNCISNKALTEKTWIDLSKKYRTSIPTLKAKWKGLRDMFRVEIKRIPRSTSGEMVVEPHEYESKWTHYKALLFLVDHMRSRNSSNFSAMDPIQKMEVIDNYPYMLHGLSQQQLSNETPNDESAATDTAAVTPDLIKVEPLDVSEVATNGNSSSNGDSGGSTEKSNDQKTENPQPDSPNGGDGNKANATETNGSASAGDANTNGAKRRKCSAGDAPASTSEENGDGKGGNNDDYHFLMSMQPFMSELSLAQKLRLRMKIQKLVFDELYGCYNDLRT